MPARQHAGRRGTLNPVRMFTIQLLPLIVFVVVDALVSDVRISIICAVLFAVGQLVVTYLRNSRFDWLVLVDVGLIAVLGGVSIAFKNDTFFKIKPAIMEGLAVGLLMALRLAPDHFTERYFGRMMPGVTLPKEAMRMMRTMLVVLSLSTVAHIGAVLYTAFFTSRETWALVSGPGFYLTLLPAVFIYLRQLKQRRRQKR
ncbi:MAG: septation protein IspZ [Deltaproteobacteria bacterium]|nr:septation protein IspZ [Deltaproteobacteria bacterium]